MEKDAGNRPRSKAAEVHANKGISQMTALGSQLQCDQIISPTSKRSPM
jgi:hypothetical protein